MPCLIFARRIRAKQVMHCHSVHQQLARGDAGDGLLNLQKRVQSVLDPATLLQLLREATAGTPWISGTHGLHWSHNRWMGIRKRRMPVAAASVGTLSAAAPRLYFGTGAFNFCPVEVMPRLCFTPRASRSCRLPVAVRMHVNRCYRRGGGLSALDAVRGCTATEGPASLPPPPPRCLP